jgi:hypothetical protein
VEAQKLFLRREHALYQERGVKPRRRSAGTEQAGACSGASNQDRDDRRFRLGGSHYEYLLAHA